MLTNVEDASSLRSLARNRSRDYETRTVLAPALETALLDDWSILKRNRKSVRLRRKKGDESRWSDRVWTLFYRMGFPYLSGSGGAVLQVGRREEEGESALGIVCVGDEIALAVTCVSAVSYTTNRAFRDEVSQLASVREPFARAVNRQFTPTVKRQAAFIMFLKNIRLSEADRQYAAEKGVLLFEERDVEYYESLVSHLGPAAKYQLLADTLPGKPVPGLAIRLPAVRARIGGTTCYTFSISPEYLLKIAYVSHRSRGKASDLNTYQRMLNKTRLRRIREYITEDGIFPTNIVINLDAKRMRFEPIQQDKQDNGTLGWLDIKPAYKSAWIIDGQHRLFAYSGHEKATAARLAILAFEGLSPSKQAGLFIDINAKQKSVKQSLLEELYAELHWDSDKPSVRTRAIISKAVQVLDSTPNRHSTGGFRVLMRLVIRQGV